MKYTLGEAAKATGKSKPTISNAIKSGKISASKRPSDNAYQIDASELHRVYPLQVKDDGLEPEPSIETNTIEPQALQAKLEAMEARLADRDRENANLRADRDREIADLRTDLDHWRRQAQDAQAAIKALADQRPAAPAARPGLIARILGRF